MNKPLRITCKSIDYRCPDILTKPKQGTSISVLGIDTEAYEDGKCFMICTSKKDIYSPEQFPACFFSRGYRGTHFVAYNLKYDEGALLQILTLDNLRELRTEGKCIYKEYTFKIIPHKMLTISRGKNNITIWDMANFFSCSLDNAAKQYLKESKIDIETKTFSKQYVQDNWNIIAEYCIKDAILVQKLASILIKQFESWDVYPRKLFSTAYISFQYFRTTCDLPTVKDIWNDSPDMLNAAMASYTGGKFEVTEKGTGDYFEYDINSAYPYEIMNLLDIRYAYIVRSDTIVKEADYGFIDVTLKIPVDIYHTAAYKINMLNTYPAGEIRRCITLQEYSFFIAHDVDVKVHYGIYMIFRKKVYPFKEEIIKLYEKKRELKRTGDKINYHLIKIFLNSLYGKFCQLIPKNGRFQTGISWNPIYAAIITANTRIRVSEMQNKYSSIVATFTDSVISHEKLDIECNKELGAWDFSTSGNGVIIGSGVYQIGDKCKMRGFDTSLDLKEVIKNKGKYLSIEVTRPYSWREVIFHNWDVERINRFTNIDRKMDINFDKKRLWLRDYKTFNDVLTRNVSSTPLFIIPSIGVL